MILLLDIAGDIDAERGDSAGCYGHVMLADLEFDVFYVRFIITEG